VTPRAIIAEIDAELARLKPRNVPAVRQVRRRFSRSLAKSEPSLVLSIADEFITRCGPADVSSGATATSHAKRKVLFRTKRRNRHKRRGR
jgi:hypothetical protein